VSVTFTDQDLYFIITLASISDFIFQPAVITYLINNVTANGHNEETRSGAGKFKDGLWLLQTGPVC
jgi:hypothetical protein